MNFVPFLEPLFTQSEGDEDVTLQVWRERVFSAILTLGTFAGFFIVLISIYTLAQRGSWVFLGIYIGVYFWLISITYIRRIAYNLRAGSFILLLYLLGLLSTFETGLVGDGRLWLVSAPIFAAIFIRGRVGLILSFVSYFTWLLFGYLFQQAILPYGYAAIEILTQPDNWSAWFSTGTTFLVIGIVVVSSVSAILNNLFTTLSQSRVLTTELEEQQSALQEQTKTLQARSSILGTVTEISRQISLILEPELLMFQAATLIEDRFDLIHVGILTLNANRDTLSIQASSGGFGQNLPNLYDEFPAKEGIFGEVLTTSQAQSRVIDPEITSDDFPYLLSNTEAIAILPLRSRQEILGMISLQSRLRQPFGPATTNSFQILADQIAVLLSNVELLSEKEAALEAERKAYRQQTQTDWQEFLSRYGQVGYRRNQTGINEIRSPEVVPEPENEQIRSIPIQIRGQVVGQLDVQKKNDSGAWTTTEINFLSTLTDRLESTLDTARLYEETQRRAEREQTTASLTDKLHRAGDIENLMNTIIQEVAQTLGASSSFVQFGSIPEQDSASAPENGSNANNSAREETR